MSPDASFDPNVWATWELVSIGLAGALFLCCLGVSLWMAVRADRSRLYWIASAVMIIAGTLGMIFAPESAPDSGEMPPAFGVATWVMLLGLLASVVGIVCRVLRRLFGKAQDKRISRNN